MSKLKKQKAHKEIAKLLSEINEKMKQARNIANEHEIIFTYENNTYYGSIEGGEDVFSIDYNGWQSSSRKC